MIVLAVLRHDQRLLDMAGSNDISASTVRRWLLEVTGLPAARAERLDRALKKITSKGGHVVLLDGTLIHTRRLTRSDNRRNYSRKNKSHGLLFLGITDTRGRLIWISAARPGRSSEITTARHKRGPLRTLALPSSCSAESQHVGSGTGPLGPGPSA